MNRAYSTLTLKAFDSAGRRRFTGIATTPAADRMGDVVEPKGAKFQLPLPLLWQHDAGQPIGEVTSARVTDKGIEIEGEVKTIDEPGRLQDRLTEAWQSLKIGLVRGLSIGFRALEDPERIKGTYGLRFPSWEWLELSAVTIPANQEASITTIKSIDIRHSHIGKNDVKVVRFYFSGAIPARMHGSAFKSDPLQTFCDCFGVKLLIINHKYAYAVALFAETWMNN